MSLPLSSDILISSSSRISSLGTKIKSKFNHRLLVLQAQWTMLLGILRFENPEEFHIKFLQIFNESSGMAQWNSKKLRGRIWNVSSLLTILGCLLTNMQAEWKYLLHKVKVFLLLFLLFFYEKQSELTPTKHLQKLK